MQTNLPAGFVATPAGREADAILRSCVHCGFCTATCPTYQLRGDELDSPRGRIYLIKAMLEGQPAGAITRRHLDRCLSCRACETTCPSGVRYHRLLDLGRAELAARQPRPLAERLLRRLLVATLTRPWLFRPLLAAGQLLRPLLPRALASKVPLPAPGQSQGWPAKLEQVARVEQSARDGQVRRMLALAGCVQPALAPNINAACARLLARLGIELFEAPAAGCCGALRWHLDAAAAALDDARRNIDAWWPHVEAGVEAIVISASGCGAHVKEYGLLLAADPAYAAKAQRIAGLARDVSEVLTGEKAALQRLFAAGSAPPPITVAFHAPCSLQHGQKISGSVEELLAIAGCTLPPIADAHLCCGSAGTYSLLQPAIAGRLRDNKLAALTASAPRLIASANVGCQMHLQSGTTLPVRHWVEVIEERLPPPVSG